MVGVSLHLETHPTQEWLWTPLRGIPMLEASRFKMKPAPVVLVAERETERRANHVQNSVYLCMI